MSFVLKKEGGVESYIGEFISQQDNSKIAFLLILLLPNRKYTVASGGNHRPLLASELKIPKIEAVVDILLPVSIIAENVEKRITQIESHAHELKQEASRINKFLQSVGVITRLKHYKAEDEKIVELFVRMDKLRATLNELLKTKAVISGILPSQYIMPRANIRYSVN